MRQVVEQLELDDAKKLASNPLFQWRTLRRLSREDLRLYAAAAGRSGVQQVEFAACSLLKDEDARAKVRRLASRVHAPRPRAVQFAMWACVPSASMRMRMLAEVPGEPAQRKVGGGQQVCEGPRCQGRQRGRGGACGRVQRRRRGGASEPGRAAPHQAALTQGRGRRGRQGRLASEEGARSAWLRCWAAP